ncbi:MAG TPA: hypothetical protein PKB06_02260, partial [Actinotalea sp.]|nr:hypothetical protein [Actinotalea sp.]
EITVPLLVFTWPGSDPPAGWRAAPPQAPAWWHETQRPPQPGGRRSRRAGPVTSDVALPIEEPAHPVQPEAGQGTLAFEVPAAPAQGDLASQLAGSPLLAEQIARAGRAAPQVDQVAAVARVLVAGEGRAHRETVAGVLGVPAAALPLATLGRVLNVEGYRVIWLDPDGQTVRLDLALLREQFDLRRVGG